MTTEQHFADDTSNVVNAQNIQRVLSHYLLESHGPKDFCRWWKILVKVQFTREIVQCHGSTFLTIPLTIDESQNLHDSTL